MVLFKGRKRISRFLLCNGLFLHHRGCDSICSSRSASCYPMYPGWCRCSRSIISSIQMYTDGATRRNLRICNSRTSVILHSFMGDRFCSNLFTARSDQEKCSRRIKTKTLSFLTTVGTERICSCRI